MYRFTFLVLVSTLLMPGAFGAGLRARHDADTNAIRVYRIGEDKPILTQNTRPDFRPYIHPIVAPDGLGVLTEDSPDHHPHQTGLYWGLTRVNGRDYFHKPGGDHWRRVFAVVLKPESTATDLRVKWQTVYDLLDESGKTVMRETQTWTMHEEDQAYVLDFEWSGKAETDIAVSEFEYGGLFLRMPWREKMDARAFNSTRNADLNAEGKRASWMDLGMRVEGRENQAHIAIFDHLRNKGFPQPWRVDDSFGVGPVRARLGEWTIKAGETELIRHRIRVYTHEFNDASLTEAWASYVGRMNSEVAEEWDLALEEGFEAEFLTPDKAVAAMTVPDGFRAQVFAAEPMISQPMAFCWDDRGRLWIAENRDYVGRGAGSTFSDESRISILEDTDRDGVADTKKVFLESVLNPSAMAVGMGGLWLGAIPDLLFVPDRDGDDRADEGDIEVRLTGWGNRDMHEILNSLHWGPDGWLYGLQGVFTPSVVGKPAGKSAVYQSPKERAPVPPTKKIVKDGKTDLVAGGKFTGRGRDDKEIVWSFSEDGKFHLSESQSGGPIAGTYVQKGQKIQIETKEFKTELAYDGESLNQPFEYAEEPTEINGGVWRYHPTKDRFEVVAHGLSNAWGIDYDAKGQLFVSACVIPHIWHIVQGGIYHRQAGRHFNPHAYSDIRTIGDHRHRSAHGGARIYQSDAFSAEYQGRMFMGNIHEHAVLTDILERKGSGFVGRHGDDFMLANNAQFVGFSTEIGPDGAVYMLDWHDADICGGSVRTRDTGRVFRLSPAVSNAKDWDGRYGNLGTFDDAALVQLQLSTSAWHSQRARVILQGRAAKGSLQDGTHAALRDIFDTNKNGDHRLRALWGLHVTGGLNESQLLAALDDADEYVRAWAIQLLCEDKAPTNAARERFAVMAEKDASPVVRLYLASAMQRMDIDQRWPIAERLVRHSEDAEDHNISKMIWYGFEPLVPGDPQRALDIAESSQIPLITQYVARRLTAADQLEVLVGKIGASPGSRKLLLAGMREGLDGSFNAVAPSNWAAAYGAFRTEDAESASIALELSLLFGDEVAAKALVETVRDTAASLADRQQAVRGLASRKRPELEPVLVPLLDDDAMRREAIRAIASYDDKALARAVLDRYAQFSTQEKQDVVYALASRPGHGTRFMEAIDDGVVPRRDIPPYIARSLFRVVGNRFLAVWGPIEDLSPDTAAAFEKYGALLTEERLEKADARRGREVFNKVCFACHQLYGEGGQVGPDLTGANRTDVSYLLNNILTPSAIVQDDYKMQLISTNDSQLFSGVLAGEDGRQVTLKVANGAEPVTIPKSQITDREITEMSMMPDGLFDNLSDDEVADLVAFLRALEPVTMHEDGAK